MSKAILKSASINFTLMGDNVRSGSRVNTADLTELLEQMKTAVSSDALPLPVFPQQIGDYLERALNGDVYAAREFAETLNGYVTIAVRSEENDDTSVMIVDDENHDFSTLRRASDESHAFVIASLHHLGERCLQVARQMEVPVPDDEPGL